MIGAEKQRKWTPVFSKPVTYLLATWSALGLIPLLVKIFGINFLPSTEWLAMSHGPGIAVGSASAALLFWVVGKGVDKNPPGGNFKNAAVILIAPFFGFFIGQSAVSAAGPMIFALVAGKQTELSFTVEDGRRGRIRGCSSPVELRDLPFVFNLVCGIPDEVRRGLSAGSRVLMTGHGTSYGIFVSGIRKAD